MKGAIGYMNNHCNKHRGCGCMKMARGYWRNFPYYTGPCPDGDGCYRPNCNTDDNASDEQDECECTCECTCECHCECEDQCDQCDRCDRCGRCGRCRRCGRPRRCRKEKHCRPHWLCNGMFTAWLPIAISPNGIVPLTLNNACREARFDVNSGLITVRDAGTYLATYTVQVPAAAELDTTVTLNVNGASQSAAATQIVSAAGDDTTSYTGQAIFEAAEGATVSLRSSDAINVAESAAQPIFNLSLVQLDQ